MDNETDLLSFECFKRNRSPIVTKFLIPLKMDWNYFSSSSSILKSKMVLWCVHVYSKI